MSDNEKKVLVVDDRIHANSITLAALDAALSPIGLSVKSVIEAAIPNKWRNRQKSKCILPRCENMTNHRGGYCCAEHKKLHKEVSNERI